MKAESMKIIIFRFDALHVPRNCVTQFEHDKNTIKTRFNTIKILSSSTGGGNCSIITDSVSQLIPAEHPIAYTPVRVLSEDLDPRFSVDYAVRPE